MPEESLIRSVQMQLNEDDLFHGARSIIAITQ